MTNTIRIQSMNDGGIVWEGSSIKAARAHFAYLLDWMSRHNQSSSDLRIRRYAGDGEWVTVITSEVR